MPASLSLVCIFTRTHTNHLLACSFDRYPLPLSFRTDEKNNDAIGPKVPELPESAYSVEHIEKIENWAHLFRTGLPQVAVRGQPFKAGGFDWRIMYFPRGTYPLICVWLSLFRVDFTNASLF
jgi:hypothetical protein